MSPPPDLTSLLAAPGLAPDTRALALFHGLAMTGRWDLAREAASFGASHGLGRMELQEAALQLVAYGGFPRAIAALELVGELDGLQGQAARARDGRDLHEFSAAGRATFERVYRQGTDEVLAHLDGLAEGFADWVLEDAYGRILARPGLDLGRRELLAVAALALADLAAPLASHIRGALRNGFATQDVEDILSACAALAEDPCLRTIRQALDRLSRKVYRA